VRDLLANRSRLPLTAEVEFSFSAFEDSDQSLSRFAAKAAPGRQTPPQERRGQARDCHLIEIRE
jgi:hypothetical protein